MKFFILLVVISIVKSEAKEKCSNSDSGKLQKLAELEKQLDDGVNKMVQQNFMKSNFKNICLPIFNEFDQKYAKVKHCYNSDTLKKTFDVSKDSSRKLRVICEFDKEVRKCK